MKIFMKFTEFKEKIIEISKNINKDESILKIICLYNEQKKTLEKKIKKSCFNLCYKKIKEIEKNNVLSNESKLLIELFEF